MAVHLSVEPEALAVAAAQISEIMAETSAQIASFGSVVAGPVPAGVDDASLLASANFAAHGADFVGTATAAQSELGMGSAAVAHMAENYIAQEDANTALLM